MSIHFHTLSPPPQIPINPQDILLTSSYLCPHQMSSPHTTSYASSDSQNLAGPSYSFPAWGDSVSNSNSKSSSPLDELALDPPFPGTRPSDGELAISPVFVGMVGHQYNLTKVQISNICALYHVCLTLISLKQFHSQNIPFLSLSPPLERVCQSVMAQSASLPRPCSTSLKIGCWLLETVLTKTLR